MSPMIPMRLPRRNSPPILKPLSARPSFAKLSRDFPPTWVRARIRLEALMSRSPRFASLVVDVAGILIKGYYRELQPVVGEKIPSLSDLLTRAVLANPARMDEVDTLLRDIIANPILPELTPCRR